MTAGRPLWVWITIAVVLVAGLVAAVLVAWLRRR
jgi:hypothetical protein